jgi:hypothetical protein
LSLSIALHALYNVRASCDAGLVFEDAPRTQFLRLLEDVMAQARTSDRG